jgi:hypothetical protein
VIVFIGVNEPRDLAPNPLHGGRLGPAPKHAAATASLALASGGAGAVTATLVLLSSSVFVAFAFVFVIALNVYQLHREVLRLHRRGKLLGWLHTQTHTHTRPPRKEDDYFFE